MNNPKEAVTSSSIIQVLRAAIKHLISSVSIETGKSLEDSRELVAQTLASICKEENVPVISRHDLKEFNAIIKTINTSEKTKETYSEFIKIMESYLWE